MEATTTNTAAAAGRSGRPATRGEHPVEVPSVAHASVATPTTSASSCPGKRPYHTLLTTQATNYQQWQSRIMYFHYKKQQRLDGPCTEMGGFTRRVASEDGKPDGLEGEMPSVFVREYTREQIAKYGHFGVLNRPYSVVQLLEAGGFDRIAEEYVYIAETDHVFMKPMPNSATEETAAAFVFGYMHASWGHQAVIDRHSPGTSWRDVQPVGPSPVIIHKPALRRITPLWLNLSLSLKLDPDADKRFGWVLEMWGWSIAAAQLKIRHAPDRSFQIEGGAGISARAGKERGAFIFHYTYGIEYTLGGRPQGPNQIGEWSLDKRHYGAQYPPRDLQPPPPGAADGARWLLDAWNEASAQIATWPVDTKALGTIGWRRVKGDGIASSELAQRVVGTRWTWAGISGLKFEDGGLLVTPWGQGIWGVLPKGVDYKDEGFCGPGVACLFCDFSSAMHNLKFDLAAGKFDSYRVGDGARVPGVKE